ncbi:orotate phosphoribosyltransferase [archaeon]
MIEVFELSWEEQKKELAKTVAKALFESNAIKFGDFTLTSGKKSPYYIDLRAVPSYPEQFDVITDAYKELVLNECGPKCTLVGVPTAGVPFASVVGLKAKLPVAYIRKEALNGESREHGTGKDIEGVIRDGMAPVLVDDLVSTGGSNLKAKAAMERNGHPVSDVYFLVDRQMGGIEKLKAEGLNVHYIVDVLDIVAALESEGLLDAELAGKVREYTEASK